MKNPPISKGMNMSIEYEGCVKQYIIETVEKPKMAMGLNILSVNEMVFEDKNLASFSSPIEEY